MQPALNNQRGEIGLLLLLVLVVVVVAVGGYYVIGFAADALAEHVPDKVEKDLFGGIAGKQKGWRTQPANPKQERALAVYERLRKRPGLRDLAYELHFVPEKAPNAFAMPGGALAVTDGLLALVEGEIGLATVIGHEFGHQQHRHAMRSMGRGLLTALVVMMIIGGDHGFVVNLALGVSQKANSREHEREADTYGLKMVYDTFGTTRGCLEFFEKLEKNPATRESKALSFFSTHPYTPDRIEALKKQALALEKGGKRKKGKKP